MHTMEMGLVKSLADLVIWLAPPWENKMNFNLLQNIVLLKDV